MYRQFGRRFAPDKRDKKFPLRGMLPKASERTSRSWTDNLWRGNQGNTPRCVGFGCVHWLHAAPIVPKGKKVPAVTPAKVYSLAQKLDEWPGEDYDGTSVRGGIKALQQLGYVQSYYWAATVEDSVRCVIDQGPLIIGINWYEGMCDPKADGLCYPTGECVGGHCVCVTGASRLTKQLRFLQSWNPSWGDHGHGYLSFDDFGQLLKEDGEACLAIEIGRAV
jgi:hypothetical protein